MKKLLIFFWMTCLYACGSSSTLEPGYARDFDFSESRITDNRYRINVQGNSDGTGDEVKDVALLRAAELTLQNDYDWFRILNQETQQQAGTPVTTTSPSPARQVYRDCRSLGCTTTITPAYTGADVVTVHEVDRYSTSIEIVMGDGNLDDPTSAYDASELRRSLSARY